MLTIEIKINGRLVAGAKVRNVSSLADISDYEVEAVESASDVTGLPEFHAAFPVVKHHRRQTVWALVSKVATAAYRRREPVEESAA